VGYAPYTRITTPPSPASSGTAFIVQEDSGDRFPAPPFTALVWEDQTLPDLGVDAEELTILTIDGDAMSCARGPVPISIRSDMQLAILYSQNRYSLDEPALIISNEFPVTDTGVELQVRDSQGSVTLHPRSDLGAFTGSGGGSAFSLSFAPNRSGQWYYRFLSDQRVQAEQDFFVRFSEFGG
jgi:hypothetical protein